MKPIVLNAAPPGHITDPHRHPYAEVFVVHTGDVTFTVGGADVPAQGGQVVVVPADEVHGFRNDGPERVEMVSIHPAAETQTEWLS